MAHLNRIFRPMIVAAATLAMTPLIVTSAFADDEFKIDNAKWNSERNRIEVDGKGRDNRTITVTNAATGALVGTDRVDGSDWRVRQYSPSSIPCRVRAVQSSRYGSGRSDEKNLENAPSNCDNGGGGTTTSTTVTTTSTTTSTGGVTTTTLPPIDIGLGNPQTDFKIMMNYELGMHCTGFEFAYCCVLPAYNSILAQVVKPNKTSGYSSDGNSFPELLEGDPNVGLDALGRETVVRDKALNGSGNFKKYVLKYWHDAQPRNDGNGKPQTSTLISAVEGHSMISWNTTFDSAEVVNGALQYGSYNGADGVLQGNGNMNDPSDNYQNAIWNHLYFYGNNGGPPLEGENPNNSTAEADKIRLGVSGQPIMDVVYPTDCGPALHPMGPVTTGGPNDCGGFSNGNVLTFSGSSGTVVYTQMKVLENLPVMLTSPDIWEALGLPLTTFEDSIDFFADPGLVNEDSVRPFVAMKAQMYDYDSGAPDGAGAATLDSHGDPVIGFGTAPIDIPNCERCHSNPADGTVIDNSVAEGGGTLIVDNSPNNDPGQYALVQAEYEFWNAYYDIDTEAGDSDWYSRLKSAAISMLHGHDVQHATSFTANYPGCGSLGDPNDTTGCGALPQNTRLGNESVICQRCHADNVIAAVKSATKGGVTIKPITEAIHNNHKGVSSGGTIAFTDSLGRDGGCQGCHPAHRSNGDMMGYPITLAGTNKYAGGDNRGASGGCFVGRDVHSNPGKDTDGAETPEHLNAVGQWLASNVSNSPTENTGIWCTNCHNQLGQEMWKTENMEDLVHGVGLNNPRGESSLAAVASAVGTTLAQAESWLDPKSSNPEDTTYAIWKPLPQPALCAFLTDPTNPANDGNVATIEVALSGQSCSTGTFVGPVDCSAGGGPVYNICGTFDVDNDFSVNILDFCTTSDCVADAQATLNNSSAVPVPFSAATDGRDHWLSAGEPHCADCHAAPYVEQSGNINAYPPFNYPRKASLMRYSKGHQGISCQGCHESIHGLYPVTPNTDTTSYAQAAALNDDGSHGPLKCGTCHEVNSSGVPTWVDNLRYNGQNVGSNFDRAVSWMHTFTAEADPRQEVCRNCHGDESNEVSWDNQEWTRHAWKGRTSRQTMDTVETLEGVNGGNPRYSLCRSCHGDEWSEVSCGDREWKEHLTEGRVSEQVWVDVTTTRTGGTCGW